jgi:hypothetical protein
MTVFGQKIKTSYINGPNRLNRTEIDPNREPVNRLNRTFIWFEMGLYIPPVGPTGSRV